MRTRLNRSKVNDCYSGMKRFQLSLLMLLAALCAWPFIYNECLGTARPYPVPASLPEVPDSLTAVYVSHVGRHGARYPSGPERCRHLLGALERADSLGCITPRGERLMGIVRDVIALSDGRWGALDSLGMAEQRGIAGRLHRACPRLFGAGTQTEAISSYVPRCMMSMYCFTHELDREADQTEFAAGCGPRFDALMRPFQVSEAYLDYRKEEPYSRALTQFEAETCPLEPIYAALGPDYPFKDEKEARRLALTEFKVLTDLAPMGLPSPLPEFYTEQEATRLWECLNLAHYLERAANAFSPVPAEIAGALVRDIVEKADAALSGGGVTANLRFGHAETLMPLLSLLREPGCWTLTADMGDVSAAWRDFEIVPMAANLQMRFYRGPSGAVYVQTLLNERPAAPLEPWPTLRTRLLDAADY